MQSARDAKSYPSAAWENIYDQESAALEHAFSFLRLYKERDGIVGADFMTRWEQAWRVVNLLTKARLAYERELEINGHHPTKGARHMGERKRRRDLGDYDEADTSE